MGDIIIVPAGVPELDASRRQQVGETIILTIDNRVPPRRIFRRDGLIVSVGAPVGDVGRLGDALLRGDTAAARAAALDLDGHFAVFAVSPGRVAAATDAAGSVPIYFHTANGRTVIGTRVNEVAAAAGAAPDPVSVYDFLIHRCIGHPYSWFSDVLVANPASLIDATAGLAQEHYWTPAEAPRMSTDDLIEAFREQMRRSVAEAASEPVGLLMSAGEDSRALAAFLPAGAPAQGYIFVDALNREWAFADLAAKALGLPLHPLVRDDSDIAAALADRQNCIGYGYDVMHAKAFPFMDAIPERRLLGGWTSDTLFKGFFLRPENGTLPARKPKVRSIGPAGHAVRARRMGRFNEIEPLTPTPAYEWLSMWPLSAHLHFPYYASLRRYFDHREPFFYSRMYRIAASIPAEDKLSRRFFYDATNAVIGLAAWLPTGRATIPALKGESPDLARQMVRWHDRHMHPGVPQSPWGRGIEIDQAPSFAGMRDAVEDALRDFDGGRLHGWLEERAASRGPGEPDPLISRNRIVQVGLALATASPSRRGLTRRSAGALDRETACRSSS